MTLRQVLIVDDSALQRQHVAELFDRECEIRQAADGAEGLAMLRQWQPDLVMLDLEMPHVDGVQMLQGMAAEGLRVPVLVMSGKDYMLISSVAFLGRELDLPVLGGLKKPLRREDLDELLQHIPSAESDDASVPGGNRAELAHGLQNGQFVPFFQPKVKLDGGVLEGVEVLARWQHPERGIVGPGCFIPAMEEHDLITELTLHMLQTSLQQWLRWARFGLRLPLSINLSALSLRGKTLVPAIDAIIKAARVPARYITFEITETAVAEHLAEAVGIAAQLRLCGFGLSIDDFGTGFASMQQLTRFPFTELKIDRSLVTGVSNKPHLEAIFESIVQLAGRLQLITVAEGIESEPDQQFVAERGCVLGQGFLYAKPLDAAALESWIKQRLRHCAHPAA